MKHHNCDKCRIRTYYQKKPQSILGRMWRWHTSWCPGWKRYVSSLNDAERELLRKELNQ